MIVAPDKLPVAPLGRRERKKAQTHDALADAALRLFLERGYDAVGVKEIAEAADVSTTTLFAHFPSKEALVFDEADDRERALVEAVRERPAGQSIPEALRDHLLTWWQHYAGHPGMERFTRLIAETPALAAYGRTLWTRHETALAEAIAAETAAPADDVAPLALARFALEAPELARGRADGPEALRAIFALLDQGWQRQNPTRG